MKTIFYSLIYLAALALLVACGKSAQDVANDIQGKSVQERDAMTLAGNYDAPCSTASVFGNFRSEKEVYHFGQDGSFQKKFFFFSDRNCQNPSFVRVEDGTVSYQGNSSPKDGVTADFSFTKVSIVPDNQNAVSELNLVKYCGVNNYTVGQANDVTAHSSDALCVGVTHSPRTTYDVVKLLDDSHLVFGNDLQTEDASKRPTSINQNLVFVKE